MKEKMIMLVEIFTRVVTAIFFFATLYEAIFVGMDVTFKIVDIWGIMFIAVLCAVCSLPMLSEKEYSKLTMIILQVVYFVFINAATIATGFFLHWFNFKNPVAVFSFEVVIILVYVTVIVVSYKMDADSAKKMNEKLEERNIK
ncbi:MAG: DUF3021 family protein [Treponema sp.]|nr:DUF3021 family protein [Treponema sp.]